MVKYFLVILALFLKQGHSPGGGEVIMVNKYETIFIVSPEVSEDDTKAIVEKMKGLVETSAQLESIDEWGKRKLAYPINDFSEGYYVLINFSSETNFPHELERIYKITDGIIKDIIIKKDN
jgi:small subunit ribosomal protein S6